LSIECRPLLRLCESESLYLFFVSHRFGTACMPSLDFGGKESIWPRGVVLKRAGESREMKLHHN
jgi:hypothetical protein